MPFLGALILIGLLCWIFLGKNKSEQQSVSSVHSFTTSHFDDSARFIKVVGSGKEAIYQHVAKERRPVFAAALFLYIRNQHYPLRTKLSIAELAQHTKSDYEAEDVRGLARLASSKGLVGYLDDYVDMENTPDLELLLRELFK
ncbi:MAG: hypothetical protein K0R57_4818 [Paenibacillaceae bacterium]|jgi:uncharacterized membrane-anchored protein YhcB (DUF1043 family)|nr:hypothetical protein [Paenibacillaceae bacterium]